MPRRWIKMMKASMRHLGAQFNTGRMVQQYCEKMYLRAHQFETSIASENARKARHLAEWRKSLKVRWGVITVVSEELDADAEVKSGEDFPIRARVTLGEISPEDVAVEVIYGAICGDQQVCDSLPFRLKYMGTQDGVSTFEGALPTRASGRHGYAVRVRPDHPDLVHPLTPMLMTWE
jgi:starch phosphorylase